MKKIKENESFVKIGTDVEITQKEYDEIVELLKDIGCDKTGFNYCIEMDYDNFDHFFECLLYEIKNDNDDSFTIETLIEIGIESENKNEFENTIMDNLSFSMLGNRGYFQLENGKIFELYI